MLRCVKSSSMPWSKMEWQSGHQRRRQFDKCRADLHNRKASQPENQTVETTGKKQTLNIHNWNPCKGFAASAVFSSLMSFVFTSFYGLTLASPKGTLATLRSANRLKPMRLWVIFWQDLCYYLYYFRTGIVEDGRDIYHLKLDLLDVCYTLTLDARRHSKWQVLPNSFELHMLPICIFPQQWMTGFECSALCSRFLLFSPW